MFQVITMEQYYDESEFEKSPVKIEVKTDYYNLDSTKSFT